MCICISGECFLCSGITFISDGILSDIPVIVPLHLEKEDLSLLRLGLWNQMLLEKSKDILANSSKFFFNLSLVILNFFYIMSISLIVFLLFN